MENIYFDRFCKNDGLEREREWGEKGGGYCGEIGIEESC